MSSLTLSNVCGICQPYLINICHKTIIISKMCFSSFWPSRDIKNSVSNFSGHDVKVYGTIIPYGIDSEYSFQEFIVCHFTQFLFLLIFCKISGFYNEYLAICKFATYLQIIGMKMYVVARYISQ